MQSGCRCHISVGAGGAARCLRGDYRPRACALIGDRRTFVTTHRLITLRVEIHLLAITSQRDRHRCPAFNRTIIASNCAQMHFASCMRVVVVGLIAQECRLLASCSVIYVWQPPCLCCVKNSKTMLFGHKMVQVRRTDAYCHKKH